MRARMGVGIVSLLAIQVVYAAAEPITSNPIPERIVKRGIAVEVVELARLPDSRGIRPADQDVKPAGWARINYVRAFPTAAGSSTTRAVSCTGSIRAISPTCTRI